MLKIPSFQYQFLSSAQLEPAISGSILSSAQLTRAGSAQLESLVPLPLWEAFLKFDSAARRVGLSFPSVRSQSGLRPKTFPASAFLCKYTHDCAVLAPIFGSLIAEVRRVYQHASICRQFRHNSSSSITAEI